MFKGSSAVAKRFSNVSGQTSSLKELIDTNMEPSSRTGTSAAVANSENSDDGANALSTAL